MRDAAFPIGAQPADLGQRGGFDIGHGGSLLCAPHPGQLGFEPIPRGSAPPCRPRGLCHKRAMSHVFALPGFDLDAFVAATLAEDLGDEGDVTSAAVIPADAMFAGVMDSRDAITVAGLPIAEAFFRALDPEVEIERLVEDGDRVVPGTDLMRLRGRARALLTAERPALNTVQHLSGIATMTRAYVDAIAGTGATLLDTRKTLPGLRRLEKYATRMGGATNHRMGLWDAAMIKDNHEVDRIAQIEPALAAGATHLLLDNMGLATLREAVALVAGRVPTEASGGVRLDTIRAIAATGVTYVSAGRLTQSAPAADIGVDFLQG